MEVTNHLLTGMILQEDVWNFFKLAQLPNPPEFSTNDFWRLEIQLYGQRVLLDVLDRRIVGKMEKSQVWSGNDDFPSTSSLICAGGLFSGVQSMLKELVKLFESTLPRKSWKMIDSFWISSMGGYRGPPSRRSVQSLESTESIIPT